MTLVDTLLSSAGLKEEIVLVKYKDCTKNDKQPY